MNAAVAASSEEYFLNPACRTPVTRGWTLNLLAESKIVVRKIRRVHSIYLPPTEDPNRAPNGHNIPSIQRRMNLVVVVAICANVA